MHKEKILKTSSVIYKIAALAPYLALVSAILLTYHPVLDNAFVAWDDNLYIYENPDIRNLDTNLLRSLVTDQFNIWHPLTILSHALDYAFWRLDPWGHHLTNLILHILNTLLFFITVVWLIDYKSFGRKPLIGNMPSKKAFVSGIVSALIMGIHPIHVESVAWISDRKDLLCTFFIMLSTISYLRYTTSEKAKRYAYYMLSLFFFLFALMSKPMAVTLPIIFLILDYYPLGRTSMEGRLKNLWLLTVEKGPFLFLSIASSSITLWAYYSVGGLETLDTVPLIMRLLLVTRACIFYLVKMALPFNLVPLYPTPTEIDFINFYYLGPLMLFAFITLFCIYSLTRTKLFVTVWLYYIVTLLPVTGLIQSGIPAIADRYTYLPGLAPSLLVGIGAGLFYEKYKKMQSKIIMLLSILLIMLVMTNKTRKQVAVWSDSLSLWTHQISIYPDIKHKAYSNRGIAYGSLGDFHLAIEDFNKAININPLEAITYSNRGNAYNNLGNYQQAIKDLEKAIILDPGYARAYNNRGNVHFNLGKNQLALRDYAKAIEIEPKLSDAYYNRGNVYNNSGNYAQAVTDFDKAIRLDPLNAQGYNNRGLAHKNLGNYRRAIDDYLKAIELDPLFAGAYYNLGMEYSASGKTEKARIYYERAARLGLEEAKTHLYK